MKTRIKTAAVWLLVALLVGGCEDAATPRPYGYFRIDLPPHQYTAFAEPDYPFTFDYSTFATVVPRSSAAGTYWLDVSYPSIRANIYCTYKPVRSDLPRLVEDTRNIVYKHALQADAIADVPYENRAKNVYGILYELHGNVASPVQFVLTDSVRHFFRGALYFETVPNKDSIAPVAQYVQEDIVRLIEGFEWK